MGKDEFERMQQSAGTVAVDDRYEKRRRELKRLSDERVKGWPNTLDAIRIKKENWKKEKMEEDERKRREIDKKVHAQVCWKRERSCQTTGRNL